MLESLIGAQILRIEGTTIRVKLNEQVYVLEMEVDHGDCCGFAHVDAQLLYAENDNRNPVITNITFENNGGYEDDASIVTFYGENKELALIESHAGSGSGWAYGACVTLRCLSLGIEENLAQW